MSHQNGKQPEQLGQLVQEKPDFHSLVGHRAPIFTARSTTGDIHLKSFRGRWVILCFHPADFTPVCTTEFIELARRKAEFKALNTEILGISVDSIFSHLAWVEWMKTHYNQLVDFPIIEDISMTISKAYGMVDSHDTSTAGVRACVFIDPEGMISALIHYPMQIGRSVDEILRVQQALIAVSKSGKTCPVDWRAGQEMLEYPEMDAIKSSHGWLETAMRGYGKKNQ